MIIGVCVGGPCNGEVIAQPNDVYRFEVTEFNMLKDPYNGELFMYERYTEPGYRKNYYEWRLVTDTLNKPEY